MKMPERLKRVLAATEGQFGERMAQMQRARRYYENRAAICSTGAAAINEVNGYLKKLGKNPLRSADNRISTNWHRIITDQKAGYMCSFPPQIEVLGDSEATEAVNRTLGAEFGRMLKSLCIDAANYGVGWLAYWYDEGKPFGFGRVEPMQIRAVYDEEQIKPRLTELVRTVRVDGTVFYELWDDRTVSYYRDDGSGNIEADEGGVIEHSYGEIPFIPFYNNGDRSGDLEMYRSIIDAIDKLISGFANDIDDMQEIIWVIKNYAGEFSDTEYDKDGKEIPREIDLLRKIKTRKLISVEGDGGVDTLRSEIPYEARGRFLDILMRQLYISAMAVDPFPKAIGQASGVYIDFLYSLLELKAGMAETEFRPAVDRLCRAVMRSLKLPENEIEQVWIRNKPRDALETVEMMAKTPAGVISDETMTKAHPLTENWQTERGRIERQTDGREKDAEI